MLDHYGAEVYSSYITSQIAQEIQQRSVRRLADEETASATPGHSASLAERSQRVFALMFTAITRTFRQAV